MISTSPAALKYAKAAFEALSFDKVQSLVKELHDFRALVEKDAGIKEFYFSPVVPADKKVETLAKLGDKVSPETMSLLKALSQRGRMGLLQEVAAAIQELADEKNKVIKCEIRSAHPVDDQKKAELEKIVKEKTGKTAQFTYTIDKTLLGSIKVVAGGLTIDDSLQNHLSRLKEEFKN